MLHVSFCQPDFGTVVINYFSVGHFSVMFIKYMLDAWSFVFREEVPVSQFFW